MFSAYIATAKSIIINNKTVYNIQLYINNIYFISIK